MKISVIIVSYNVRYFLESCLRSVYHALDGLEGEVIVVDNNSVDGSVSMISALFPKTIIVENDHNAGFAKANNQGIAIAQGQYILLLNPDTLIEDATLKKVCDFMDAHPEGGALGVKMIDGKGRFLPESKRAVPTPGVAFFKIFGLSRLFPFSPRINRYNLGHLDPDKDHEVEILSGAFMLIRKEVLGKTGNLDEDYFMYGEDIDLSFRILKAGYKNFYYAGTTIVHYKGESTKKGSLNYVMMFYQAMLKFADKHFTRARSKWLGFVIRPAIYFRASLSVMRRIVLRYVYPLLDLILFYLGYMFLIPAWENLHFEGLYTYPPLYRYVIIPMYILTWMAGIGISGGYARPLRLWKFIRGILFALVFILILYALLPLSLRFSRILILTGAVWAVASGILYRVLFSFLPWPELRLSAVRKKNVVIVGEEETWSRISAFLEALPFDTTVVGLVNTVEGKTGKHTLGNLDHIADIVRIHGVHEVIFSVEDVAPEKIIRTMNHLGTLPVTFRIALPESSFILGSDSVRTAGELYLVGMNAVTLAENRIRKRILDFLLSVIFMLTFVVTFFLVDHPRKFLGNCIRVFLGRCTWVGFCPPGEPGERSNTGQLPPGIICPAANMPEGEKEVPEWTSRINLSYARNYHLWKDVRIILSRFRELGS